MPDDPTTGAGQDPAGSGQDPQGDPNPNPAGGQDPADDFDKDRALATIANLRQFEKLSKTQARELEALRQQVKANDDAKLSETEKLTARAADLERQNAELTTRLQEQAVGGAVATAAAKAGALYPDAVHRLIDYAEIEYAEDGSPKNVEKLVADARKAYPALFRAAAGSADAGTGGQGQPSMGMNSLIRQAAGRSP